MAINLRIIASPKEASLHPRAIWNRWKKNHNGVIWDPRSYYGVLEFSGVLVCILASFGFNTYGCRKVFLSSAGLNLFSGSMLLLPIAALHWYSNHRQSTSILTRSRTHIIVLLSVTLLVFALQVINVIIFPMCISNGTGHLRIVLWMSILVLLIATYVVYTNARNPLRDPVFAELPSPTMYTYDLPEDDESQRIWARSTIADGIEDDSPDLEGQIKL